ncbi:MAG: YbaN family protein [Ilumatobacter sp.]|uniref:YbaN family protein n=1 Tax=Ilumatobacter sp. TaxID=1967498 RepID=UPI0026371A4C|nr:YbaN family protein [Ilumatobacter sp.]MDJ0769669.1 YbaN family protein [Ilumatobacter sp.]
MQRLLDLLRRGAWVALGLLSVAVGAIGIVVPGLPTTVFFIAAAACFAKSNPRLEQWVLDLPRIGPAVQRYRDGLGMPIRAKYWAIGMIVVFTSISIVVVDVLAFRIGIALVAAVGVWYVGRRVPTTPPELLTNPG